MTKIFKHLAKHWAACLVIIALLLVQAYGDLTLPDYTSKIVDTGIQQSGIADAVPEVVRDSTLQVLELLMTDADGAAVEALHPAGRHRQRTLLRYQLTEKARIPLYGPPAAG